MTTPYLAQDIESEEGRRYRAYPDPDTKAAPWTIGVGHTGPEVHEGLVWTDAQIDAALTSDIARAETMLGRFYPWWTGLDDVRQDVMVQMCFQLGIGGLEKFPKALASVRAGNWQEAHDQMLDSEWARTQSPARAEREAEQMLTGTRSWP